MSLAMPTYITPGHLERLLSYRWDAEVEDDVLLPQPRIAHRFSAMSDRAALSFCLGSLEWIVYRLKPHLEDDSPLQVLEAAWAAVVDFRYLKTLDMPEWEMQYERRIGGPLGQGFWLLTMAFVAAHRNRPLIEQPVSISEIAMRVSGDPESVKTWRHSCIERLIQAYPANPEEHLGPPVPREALDPSYIPSPTQDAVHIARHLAALDWGGNPYLRRPEDAPAE